MASFEGPPGASCDAEVVVADVEAAEKRPSPKCGVFFAMCAACAVLNNLSFSVVAGAAQDLARQFHRENDSNLLTTALGLSALVASFLSARCLIQYRYWPRIVLVLSLNFATYLGIGVSIFIGDARGLWISTVCACFAGLAQVIGETTNLAFFRNFPPEMVGAWGGGTGIAGVVGPLGYLALRSIASSSAIFLWAAPTLPVAYLACWLHLYARAADGLSGPELQKALGGSAAIQAARAAEDAARADAGPVATLLFARERAALRAAGHIMFNLCAVYCLSYFVHTGLADRETYCAPAGYYTAMWATYNVGITVSRASVAVLRVRRLWIITLLQLVSIIGWIAEVFLGFVRGVSGGYAVMAGWMVVVGLCGGASYANCMYLFNHDPDIPDSLRELGINLGFLMSTVGIFLATSSFSLLNRTILSPDVLYAEGCL